MEVPRGRTEEGLICRFQDGDRDAFEALFSSHTPVLTSRILRGLPARLARRVSVEDVAHLALDDSRLAIEPPPLAIDAPLLARSREP